MNEVRWVKYQPNPVPKILYVRLLRNVVSTRITWQSASGTGSVIFAGDPNDPKPLAGHRASVN